MVRSTTRPVPPPSVVVALSATAPSVPLPVPLSPVAVPTAIVATAPPARPHSTGGWLKNVSDVRPLIPVIGCATWHDIIPQAV